MSTHQPENVQVDGATLAEPTQAMFYAILAEKTAEGVAWINGLNWMSALGFALLTVIVSYVVIAFGLFLLAVLWCPRKCTAVPTISFQHWKSLFDKRHLKVYTDCVAKYGRTYCVDMTIYTSDPVIVKQMLNNKVHLAKLSRYVKFVWTLLPHAGSPKDEGEAWLRSSKLKHPVFSITNVFAYAPEVGRRLKMFVSRNMEQVTVTNGSGNTSAAMGAPMSDSQSVAADSSAGGASPSSAPRNQPATSVEYRSDDLVATINTESLNLVIMIVMGMDPDTDLAAKVRAKFNQNTRMVDTALTVHFLKVPTLLLVTLRSLVLRYKTRNLIRPFCQAVRAGKTPKEAISCDTGINFFTQLASAGYTDNQIIDQIAYIQQASRGTATMAGAMMFHLSRNATHTSNGNPWVAKMRKEFEEVLPEGTDPDATSLRKLPIFTRVMNECARLSPATFRPARRNGAPVTTHDGKVIPAGYDIAICLYALHNDPELWDDPDTFNPDRFINMPTEYAFIPFMAGRRMCSGMLLGKMFLIVFMREIIMNYEWEVPVDELKYRSHTAPIFEPIPFILRPRTDMKTKLA